MKKGMYTDSGEEIFSDRQVAALRMTFASLALAPFAIVKLKKVLRWKDVLLLAIVGFFGNFFPAYLFTYAETGISSGYTGMLNSFTPIFALVIGFLVFRNKLSGMQMFGVLVGTIGIVLLSISGADLSISGSMWHIGAVIIATLCYAISLNTIKYTLQSYSGIEITAIAFFLILLPSVASNIYDDTWTVIVSNPHAGEGLIYIAILAVVGTAFAVYLFNILIANSSVLFSSSVTYLIPIVAVVIGLVYGERINIYQVLSMGVILLGVFIANVIPKLKK
jgi:drug/metabolite transporter (DMT)-like permease